MASLKKIASAAGVSVRTVRRAFDPEAYVRPEVREQILAIAREADYRPDPIARSLSLQKSCTVTVVVESFYELYIRRLEALERCLRQADYNVSFVFEPIADPNAAPILEDILRFRPAAVVLLPLPHGMPLWVVDELCQRKVPCVVVDAIAHIDGVDEVKVDRAAGVYQAVNYLLESGRKHVAFLGQPTDVTRLPAYERAVAEAGHTPIVIPAKDRDTKEQFAAGREAGRAMRERFPHVDAVQAYSDAMAMGFIAGLQDAGLRVPADIAVVGFDDRSMAACCSPPLTTVAHPNEELGTTAAKLLLRRLAGHVAAGTFQLEVLPTRLVCRETV